jgi:hypothetical protein
MNKKVASPHIFKLGLVGGCELHFRIEQDKTGCVTVTTELLRNGRPVTEREADCWQEIMPAATAIMVRGLSTAAGKQKVATEMAEWLKEYQKATSMRRSPVPSLEREEGMRFYKSWRRHILAAQESGQEFSDSDQIKYLAPLLAALRKPNTEFLKGLEESAQILSNRIYNSKDASGEYLDRWLLDYKLRLFGGVAKHTVRELNEQFVSKFRYISDKKLRERCRKLNIPLKDDVRGAGAVRRKRSNGTAHTAKGLIDQIN